MPAEDVAKDSIDNVGSANALVMPTRPGQCQIGSTLDKGLLDGIEILEPA